MKPFIVTLVALNFLGAAVSFADDKAKTEKFESHKAEALKRIEENMGKMAEHKACVTAATKPEEMKACRDKMKEWHKAHKKERGHHEDDHHE
ncbi:MAG: hypothetical protein EBQ85_03420 [Proteobacteria bacterium]|nr:hypothetical protein [Pseudomonadota bacterium]